MDKTNFVCGCPKHGLDVHDGTKNECCEDSIILPMLDAEGVARLVPEGQKRFREDMLAFAELVESGGVHMTADTDLELWYRLQGFPLIEAEFVAAVDEAEAELEGDLEEREAAVPEFNPDAYFMAGFEQGVSIGFDKGFDLGLKKGQGLVAVKKLITPKK